MEPFTALYGREPPSILNYLASSTTIDSLDSSLQQRQEILSQLKVNLNKSRKQMENQANKKHLDFTFKVGDRVLLMLAPYRQQTVAHRTSQKLAKRFFGPFHVVKRIEEVAYALDMPSSSRIHHVFHVSMLRPRYGERRTHASTLPLNFSDIFLKDVFNSEEQNQTQVQRKKMDVTQFFKSTNQVQVESNERLDYC